MLDSAERFRVFWVPGCSSCVRVKEFLTKLGVPYESVNAATDPNALEDMRRLGAQSVPFVSRGDAFVFAQSLDQVAAFVGREAHFDRLSPDALMARWRHILDVSRSIAREIPARHLGFKPMADRNRTVLDLAYHIHQVVDAFLQNVEDGATELKPIDEPTPPEVKAAPDILAYAEPLSRRLDQWWRNLADKSCRWDVTTFYGTQPAHHFLERSTWHSAQHARQLVFVLDELKVTLSRRLGPADFKGLPLPDGLWQ